MKKILFLFFAILFLVQFTNAQETFFQTGHTNDILEVHFSPDDSQLVSYSAGDGRFILWDVKSGRQIWTRKTSFIRKANERINLKEFYWSKDGKTLVTKSVNGTYQIWDALTGNVIALTETKPEIELIAPNKKEVSYTKDYSNLTVTDSESGATKEFKRFGNNSAFNTSNDGTMIVEGGSWGDASIKITEIKTGRSWWLDGHPSIVGAIAFSPDGKFLAVGGSDKTIYLFDTVSKKVIENISGNSKPIVSLAFSPNGEKLVSVEKYGFLRVWDWQTKSQIKQIAFEFPFAPHIVKFSPDGKYLLAANDASGMELYDTNSWKQTRKFCIDENTGYDCGSKVSSVNFSVDGKKVLASYENGTIKIWDLAKVKPIKILKYGKGKNYSAFLSNETTIVAASEQEDLAIKFFDSLTGRETKTIKNPDIDGFVDNLAISPNRKSFITSGISGIQLWNANNSKLLREFEIGFSDDDSIVFSPDGKTFAVGGRNQNLFLFDVETGEKLWQLIPSYQPGELEIQFEESGKKGRAEVEARKAERNKQAEAEVPTIAKKITAKFSHYGDAESFWDQRIAESGAANKSKMKLPKEKAKVAWFTLTNDADLPVSIDTNSMIFNPQCKGLCEGSEISSRYVMELKNGDVRVNGFDMFSSTILPPKTTIYFSVALEHFGASRAIYLGFTFQKDNPDDENSDDYGTEQKLYLRESDLPE